MNSLQELGLIRDKMKQTVSTRTATHDATRVVVAMGTCGIAAGARELLSAFTQEVAASTLSDVIVTQSGCVNLCQMEPVVEIYQKGKEKVTYVKLRPDMVAEIVQKHLVGGQAVKEYTLGAAPR